MECILYFLMFHVLVNGLECNIFMSTIRFNSCVKRSFLSIQFIKLCYYPALYIS